MDTFHSVKAAARALDEPVVVIGNFDGVHRGHRAIISRAVEMADDRDNQSLCLTFEPHPSRFFYPDAPPFRLTTPDQKTEQLAELGCDAQLVVEFTEDVAELEPEAFVERFLYRELTATAVIVGDDFRFGKRRAGHAEDLETLCNQRGIETDIVETLEFEGEQISSTRIRKQLSKGHMQKVAELLGRPFELSGRVVRGQNRGAYLGFPTANIKPANRLLPPNGVYASRLRTEQGKCLRAATNVGMSPTFEDKGFAVETFVFSEQVDANFDLYDQIVQIELVEYIRQEIAFETADELTDQMETDIEEAKRILADLNT